MKEKKSIGIKKVKENFGWMGNMSNHGVEYGGKKWRNCEMLFQSLRYKNDEIIEILRNEKSPMGVKMKSKKYKDERVIMNMGDVDVENMKMVVKLKYENYEWMRKGLRKLNEMYNLFIYEDVGKRRGGNNLFWGGYFGEDGVFYGENRLGNIWMEIIKNEKI